MAWSEVACPGWHGHIVKQGDHECGLLGQSRWPPRKDNRRNLADSCSPCSQLRCSRCEHATSCHVNTPHERQWFILGGVKHYPGLLPQYHWVAQTLPRLCRAATRGCAVDRRVENCSNKEGGFADWRKPLCRIFGRRQPEVVPVWVAWSHREAG